MWMDGCVCGCVARGCTCSHACTHTPTPTHTLTHPPTHTHTHMRAHAHTCSNGSPAARFPSHGISHGTSPVPCLGHGPRLIERTCTSEGVRPKLPTAELEIRRSCLVTRPADQPIDRSNVYGQQSRNHDARMRTHNTQTHKHTRVRARIKKMHRLRYWATNPQVRSPTTHASSRHLGFLPHDLPVLPVGVVT